ncbi:Alpha/Beta hydrolase protein [Aspergillus crustosus]
MSLNAPILSPTTITTLVPTSQETPTQLHYKSQGTGPLLILIPGGHGTSLLFTPLATSLSSYHRSSHLPHPPADSGLAIKTHTDDHAELIRHVRRTSNENAILFGSSWAAYIAVNVLLWYPDLVGRVVLHEPIYVSVLPTVVQDSLRPKILEMIRISKEKGTNAANRLLMPLTGSAADRRGMSMSDDPEALAFPTDPAMIMSGVLQTPVLRVPGGHMGYVTRETEFAERLKEYLFGFGVLPYSNGGEVARL